MNTSKSENKIADAQALIVGGGLAGLVAAHAVAKTGLDVIHLAPLAPVDRRTSALMSPSVKILTDLGLVQNPDELGVALKKIRIIDATNRLIRAPEVLFESSEAGEAAFGWNFANTILGAQIASQARHLPNLSRIAASATRMRRENGVWALELGNGQTVKAALVVGADGKKSLVRRASGIGARERRHQQSALVCDLQLGRPLNNESVEFHYQNGPFTLVPSGNNGANLVWIDSNDTLQQLVSQDPETIRTALEEKSQNLFGKIVMKTKAFVFPLSSLGAQTAGKNGVVLVGEAGHAFPPIGAQGLNLSLRDVADLMCCIKSMPQDTDNWAENISSLYAKKRQNDVRRTSAMVDMLFASLLVDMLPAQALRAGGIWALKTLAPLRKRAFELGMNPGG